MVAGIASTLFAMLVTIVGAMITSAPRTRILGTMVGAMITSAPRTRILGTMVGAMLASAPRTPILGTMLGAMLASTLCTRPPRAFMRRVFTVAKSTP